MSLCADPNCPLCNAARSASVQAINTGLPKDFLDRLRNMERDLFMFGRFESEPDFSTIRPILRKEKILVNEKTTTSTRPAPVSTPAPQAQPPKSAWDIAGAALEKSEIGAHYAVDGVKLAQQGIDEGKRQALAQAQAEVKEKVAKLEAELAASKAQNRQSYENGVRAGRVEAALATTVVFPYSRGEEASERLLNYFRGRPVY